MELNEKIFETLFEALTGHRPLSWQWRLYNDYFAQGQNPAVIDLPTGMGKTSVIHLWLVALAHGAKLPRRLVYVVDRRTVVDQGTGIADDLAFLLAPEDATEPHDIARQKPNLVERKKKHADVLLDLRQRLCLVDTGLAVSTLRGQLADNREWSRDPSRPAVIIGTVDLIGSALLFSGYRSGFKTKPLHAGLLGQDSLLVLDEAHLSKPFEKLIKSIHKFQCDNDKPMRVIRMSATSADDDTNRFKLEESDLNDRIIEERFTAKKRLTIETTADVIDSIATAAGKIASDKPGSRIVIFVKSPKEVEAARKALIKKDKTRETKIAMLTGTMRGLERDELVTPPTSEDQYERRVMQRFLNLDNDPSLGECFLISTSAGEVGFDLNADHLVGDAAPLDSWIQRLGRVNRRGKGTALVYIFAETPAAKKADKKDDAAKHTVASASIKAIEALKQLPLAEPLETDTRSGPIWDTSPRALRALPKPADALSPPVPTVELTDILLDAWSMTSITEPMPGRPEVAPWLRGIADDLPQTTIAWRAELDLDGFDQLDMDDVEEWFDTHRILTHETLSAPTNAAVKWFIDRWDELSDAQRAELTDRFIIVDRAGISRITVKSLIDQLSRKSTSAIQNADLVLPASFGGIRRGIGLLDATEPKLDKSEEKKLAEDQAAILKKQQEAIDVADERERYRELTTKTEEDEQANPVGLGHKPQNLKSHVRYVVELESDDDRRVQLASYIPRREKPEYGTSRESLADHVKKVRAAVDAILCRLSVSDDFRQAAQLAADFHDHGKNRERWQRLVGGEATPAGPKWLDVTLGKSGGEMKRDPRGYRHEFGSLREFIDGHSGQISNDVFDLAMHLIATHHGRGRPHFSKGGFDPDAEGKSDEIHTEAIRRFARLQRKYGWWHLAWLENLLRCAGRDRQFRAGCYRR